MVAPLVPEDCDLRGLQFMPLDIRVFGSEFHARSSDAEWRAGITLWLRAWHQVPASSLPDDDVVLARLAEFGKNVRGWRKVRENALRGWIKCDDGLLYHPVLSKEAQLAWCKRLAFRERSKKANEKRWTAENSQSDDPTRIQQGVLEGMDKDSLSDPKGSEGKGREGKGQLYKRESARGSRLPEDWILPRAWGAWAVEDKGFTDQAVRDEADKFADYWRGLSGSKGIKADWQATWRNWIRKADVGFGRTAKPANGKEYLGC